MYNYINELSESLSKLPIGCCCGNTVVNHIMYADDIVLFAPSQGCGQVPVLVLVLVLVLKYNFISTWCT